MSSPSLLTVVWLRAMVEVGLKATRSTMGSPLEMPPCTPPDLHRHRMLSGAAVLQSQYLWPATQRSQRRPGWIDKGGRTKAPVGARADVAILHVEGVVVLGA